jgi:hypothetical protein
MSERNQSPAERERTGRQSDDVSAMEASAMYAPWARASRWTMEEMRRNAHLGSAVLRQMSVAGIDNADTSVAVWTKEMDFARTVTDASLEAVAEVTPWNEAAVRVAEETVDEWFDAMLKANEESWRLFRRRFEETAEGYGDVLERYDELVDSTVDASETVVSEDQAPMSFAVSDDE